MSRMSDGGHFYFVGIVYTTCLLLTIVRGLPFMNESFSEISDSEEDLKYNSLMEDTEGNFSSPTFFSIHESVREILPTNPPQRTSFLQSSQTIDLLSVENTTKSLLLLSSSSQTNSKAASLAISTKSSHSSSIQSVSSSSFDSVVLTDDAEIVVNQTTSSFQPNKNDEDKPRSRTTDESWRNIKEEPAGQTLSKIESSIHTASTFDVENSIALNLTDLQSKTIFGRSDCKLNEPSVDCTVSESVDHSLALEKDFTLQGQENTNSLLALSTEYRRESQNEHSVSEILPQITLKSSFLSNNSSWIEDESDHDHIPSDEYGSDNKSPETDFDGTPGEFIGDEDPLKNITSRFSFLEDAKRIQSTISSENGNFTRALSVVVSVENVKEPEHNRSIQTQLNNSTEADDIEELEDITDSVISSNDSFISSMISTSFLTNTSHENISATQSMRTRFYEEIEKNASLDGEDEKMSQPVSNLTLKSMTTDVTIEEDMSSEAMNISKDMNIQITTIEYNNTTNSTSIFLEMSTTDRKIDPNDTDIMSSGDFNTHEGNSSWHSVMSNVTDFSQQNNSTIVTVEHIHIGITTVVDENLSSDSSIHKETSSREYYSMEIMNVTSITHEIVHINDTRQNDTDTSTSQSTKDLSTQDDDGSMSDSTTTEYSTLGNSSGYSYTLREVTDPLVNTSTPVSQKQLANSTQMPSDPGLESTKSISQNESTDAIPSTYRTNVTDVGGITTYPFHSKSTEHVPSTISGTQVIQKSTSRDSTETQTSEKLSLTTEFLSSRTTQKKLKTSWINSFHSPRNPKIIHVLSTISSETKLNKWDPWYYFSGMQITSIILGITLVLLVIVAYALWRTNNRRYFRILEHRTYHPLPTTTNFATTSNGIISLEF